MYVLCLVYVYVAMYRLPTSWWCVYHTVCNIYACNMYACVLGLCMWLRWLGNIVGRQFLFWAAWNMWTSETDSSPQPKKVLDGAPLCFFPLCFLHTIIVEGTNINVVTNPRLDFCVRLVDSKRDGRSKSLQFTMFVQLFSFPSSVQPHLSNE